MNGGEHRTGHGLWVGQREVLKRIKVEKSHWAGGGTKGRRWVRLSIFFFIPFGLGVKRVKSA